MCGIFAVANDRENNAAKTVFKGLKRLLYRGYDSWGIAVQSEGKIQLVKKVGEIDGISDIKNLPSSRFAIGHTRWATTGAVTKINAHPHYSTDHSFVLAQNGIVENYKELKEILIKKGYKFITQTDTEVIVRLIEAELVKTGELQEAVRSAFLKLKGRNTIIILTKSNEIIAARNGSPLVVGLNEKNEEVYLSSDVLSFASLASKMIVLDNGKLIHCVDHSLAIFDIKSGKKEQIKIEPIDIESGKIDKEGHKHFMIKEIYEAPYVLRQLTKQNNKNYLKLADKIKKARYVFTIGSGTAGGAAAQAAFYLREIAKINAISLVGADANEYYPLINNQDLMIAFSQSGETADVLEVLEEVKKKGAQIASFVNMPGSMITRMSDYKFMAQSGAEICVLSTKVYIAQLAWGYLMAKTVEGKLNQGKENLSKLANDIERFFKQNLNEVEKIADLLLPKRDIFLLGKYQNLQIAKEGMIKIVEAAYKHAHGMPAGDLKHYAITIMEKGVPVIIIVSNDKVKTDLLTAADEVGARGARVIGIAPEDHEQFDYCLKVPDAGEVSAIMNIIPLQLLAYYLAVKMGHSVDRPRNIAKSVTVK